MTDVGEIAVIGKVGPSGAVMPGVFSIVFADQTLLPEVSIVGIFDHAYIEVHQTEGYHPVLLAVDEDVHLVRHNRRIALLGTVYEVVKKAPDGTGFTQMQLHEIGQYDLAEYPLAYPYTIPDYLRSDSDTYTIETL
ncbi:MAG: hypothetical protein GY938_18645 [Ketobacter sp.]|nr:hypothetical protein [Ketobacter sp.]